MKNYRLFRTSIFFKIIFFSGSFSAFAQKSTPMPESFNLDSNAVVRYRVAGFGLGFSTMRDNILSPLRYGGFSIGSPITKYVFHPDGRIDQKTTFSQTFLDSSSTKESNSIIGIQVQSQSFRWKPSKKNNKNLYFGINSEFLLGFRTATANVNNVFSYDAGFGFGYGVLYRKSKGFGKNRVDFSAQFSSVLLGIYVRPGYSIPFPEQDGEKDKIKLNFLLANPVNHRNADFRFNTDFYFPDFSLKLLPFKFNVSKMIAYRISYSWQYRDFNGLSRYQRGVSGFQFGAIVKMN